MIDNKFRLKLENIELLIDKHGDHDQADHGNWARGVLASAEVKMDGKTLTGIINRVKDEGGLTISMIDGSEPKTGFTFARGRQYGSIVDANTFYADSDVLASYYIKHKADLTGGKYYLGLWHNEADGQVYLDVAENIQDRQTAIEQGEKNDQISIWDVVNKIEIQTGGSGVVKETASSRNAGYVKDDRRGNPSLRKRDMGKVAKREPRYKVIYFDYGLKPVLKHPGGPDHDQLDHGSWATGRSAEDVKRISEFRERGPSIANLNESLESSTGEIDRDKARFMIENDSNLNDDVENRISDIISTIEEQDGEPMSEEDKLNNYDDYRNQATEELIDEQPDFLEEYARVNEYGSLTEPENADALRESFNDVYGLEQTATFRDGEREGEEITMTSTVTEVTLESQDTIKVVTNVEDENGNRLNEDEIIRYLTKDEESGTWSVEHSLLRLDKEFRGLGFGGKFLQQSEDYYVAKGFTHIKLNAGLEDGARHWANSGFDWNRDELDFSVQQIDNFIKETERRANLDYFTDGNDNDISLSGEAKQNLLQDLGSARTLLNNMRRPDGAIKDMKNDDFPKPRDFASLGASRPIILEDGTKTYSGKILLTNKYLPYMKFLTAEGQNLLSGPIDMDGDGLVYDGTPREKPVSSVGKK